MNINTYNLYKQKDFTNFREIHSAVLVERWIAQLLFISLRFCVLLHDKKKRVIL